MAEVTGAPAILWGTSMVGFGSLHYRYASGREGDTFVVGFAPRAAALTIYGILSADEDRPLPDGFGPHTTGKGCVYVKDLRAINAGVLATVVATAWKTHD